MLFVQDLTEAVTAAFDDVEKVRTNEELGPHKSMIGM